ncbi:flagellar hook-basal body protein [Ruminococcaceae bacterium OttesenSCG-928-O06]|nr:flagellar hook-basal body protein [Ruminococcaceae bacterium OttesenSCG-928-O06]
MSMIAFYTGAAGMRAYQNGMNVTAHNIANVQTTGYKARRAVFQDLLYNRINTNVEGNHLVGHGVKQEKIDQLMGQAGLDQTMYTLDFAIVGDGFFQVDNNGTIEYTRNGAFDLSVENGVPTLVTNDGAYVLDRAGNRITLEQLPDGSFTTDGLADRLGVYTFPNQWGLNPENNARYTVSANSGEAQLAIPGQTVKPLEVIQGALEFSGTTLQNEFVNIITYQRAYQISSRVLQTADQIAEELNNLR